MKTPLFCCFLLLFCLSGSLAQSSCPRGLVNDPAPGQCGLYVDSNNDNICDRSQQLPAPVKQSSTSGNSGTLWMILFSVLVVLSEVVSSLRPQMTARLRFFWRWLYLLSFVVCAATGMAFIFRAGGALAVFWHDVSGVAFILLSLQHLYHHKGHLICRWPGSACR